MKKTVKKKKPVSEAARKKMRKAWKRRKQAQLAKLAGAPLVHEIINNAVGAVNPVPEQQKQKTVYQLLAEIEMTVQEARRLLG